MDKQIIDIANRRQLARPEQLARIIAHVAAAPFAADLLEVDEALWGGFWHFDVIAPGYRLPAVELALLRAVRLDKTWPEETGVAQFLADLRQAITHPQAGVWSLTAVEAPCLVIAAATGQLSMPGQTLATVVWYCAVTGRLQAGYRTAPDQLRFPEALEQREPGFDYKSGTRHHKPGWVVQTVESREISPEDPLAVRLDIEILRWR